MRFDLTDLRLFLHVAEAASITGGAARSAWRWHPRAPGSAGWRRNSAPRCCERERRGVRLTPAGRALGIMPGTWVSSSNTCVATSPATRKGCGGMCVCLANTAAAAEFLPEPLADYLAANPEIDVELEERPSHEIVAAVAGGLADAGIVADTVDLGGLETAIRSRSIAWWWSAAATIPPWPAVAAWPWRT